MALTQAEVARLCCGLQAIASPCEEALRTVPRVARRRVRALHASASAHDVRSAPEVLLHSIESYDLAGDTQTILGQGCSVEHMCRGLALFGRYLDMVLGNPAIYEPRFPPRDILRFCTTLGNAVDEQHFTPGRMEEALPQLELMCVLGWDTRGATAFDFVDFFFRDLCPALVPRPINLAGVHRAALEALRHQMCSKAFVATPHRDAACIAIRTVLGPLAAPAPKSVSNPGLERSPAPTTSA